MKEAIIRQAVDADIDALVRMYGALYDMLSRQGMPYLLDRERTRDVLSAQIRSKLFCILVAEREQPQGFISASVSRIDRKLQGALVGVVNDIYLEPAARGEGTASALLLKAEAWMRAAGAASVQCDVVVGNEIGHRFWRAHGYQDVSVSTYKKL